jgi:hypothetical protein
MSNFQSPVWQQQFHGCFYSGQYAASNALLRQRFLMAMGGRDGIACTGMRSQECRCFGDTVGRSMALPMRKNDQQNALSCQAAAAPAREPTPFTIVIEDAENDLS